jgi:hypothetical protein
MRKPEKEEMARSWALGELSNDTAFGAELKMPLLINVIWEA